jgi:mannose-6-phosphate isomerase
MNALYPLKFAPVFKEKLWGGVKIREVLGLEFAPLPNCGEAWVLSGVPGSETHVANGFLEGNTLTELVEVYMDNLVGEKNFERSQTGFPLLVKFIDSREWLSIQVHPDDELAEKRGLDSGKSEMWYVLQADPGAEIIAGFRRRVDLKTYQDHVDRKTLPEILNREPVAAGDVFHIPAGRVHAMGPGILLAEIQQASDTTYRIYDWDRTDDRGNPRDLHMTEALQAIDFTVPESYRSLYPKGRGTVAPLAADPHFSVSLLDLEQELTREYGYLDSFVIHLCTAGTYRLEYVGGSEEVTRGEAVLLPAVMEDVRIVPGTRARILEIYIP